MRSHVTAVAESGPRNKYGTGLDDPILSVPDHVHVRTGSHRIRPRCEILYRALKGHQLFKRESLSDQPNVSIVSVNSELNRSFHSLDQRASITLTADAAMGMIVTVEEAHCLLGACFRQPTSVLLHGRIRHPVHLPIFPFNASLPDFYSNFLHLSRSFRRMGLFARPLSPRKLAACTADTCPGFRLHHI